MTKIFKKFGWWGAVLGLALSIVVLPTRAVAQYEGQYQQDQQQQDDPPTRVARLGYLEGSVSFQPAGEDDWVQAVPNRPLTTGDKLWADQNSRAELQLGSAVIRLNENTGFSFLNLDDNTVQIQLTSGTLNIRVRRLDQNDYFEVDTPNLAFTVGQPGSYRLEASEDGTYTVVSLRDGGGQATGNGQTYTLHAGQRATFSGTDSLSADVEDLGGSDRFDAWAYNRDRRYDDSRSARYLSHDVVGYEDLDDYGDWRDDSSYGHVWFPTQVEVGWAPYHTGHWDWIAPWGYTWVDDSPWGYAPFHYGRWVSIGGRWGWIAGPVAVRAVYAPALVVFIGGGPGGWGGNVGWFPLGPREVYVPPYQVSRGYMNQVNISNTTVNTTTITNVYNTTIINKNTTITNVTYANRDVRGAVTAVPQRAFVGAQPVARAAVAVNEQQLRSAPINARVAVAPTRESVLGAKAATAGRVSAPPPTVMNRQVIAKKAPPPPPVPFAKQQQALAAHPGQSVAPRELQAMRPAAAAAAHPLVKQAPPGRPATPTMGRPGTQPNAARPAQPGMPPTANQPANRLPNQPAPNQPPANQRPATPAEPNRPPAAQPSRPMPSPQPGNRPDLNRPEPMRPTSTTGTDHTPTGQSPNIRPNQPSNPPEPNRPPANRPAPPTETNRPPAAVQPPTNRPVPPNNPPEANRPPANRPAPPPAAAQPPTNRPPVAQPNRPEPARPEPRPSQPPPRPQTPPAAEHPPQRTPPPVETRPAPPPPRQQPQPKQTPEQKKQEEDKNKKEKPPGA